ncbi:hypothetical protein LWI29_020685 [Acer saccharum]|uniref:Uncharacterized protein n=1 Tax=Acer saccharum TaxID=4024 RepID=A0AA39RSL0_ACESA|nr:hypothetical protein LWI29_020685 [Acer saccharum]
MTTYVSYLVFAENLISWVDDNPAEVIVGLARSNNGQNRSIYLHWVHHDEDDDDFVPKKREDGLLEASNNGQNRTIYLYQVHLGGEDDGFFPKKRADGWLESELGEFFSGCDAKGELSMTVKTCWKDCLLIQGIEIRPKKE